MRHSFMAATRLVITHHPLSNIVKGTELADDLTTGISHCHDTAVVPKKILLEKALQ